MNRTGRCSASLLLDLATQYKEDPLCHRATLAGETVVLFFDKPSTRTRISLETAVVRLGGLPIAVQPTEPPMNEHDDHEPHHESADQPPVG